MVFTRYLFPQKALSLMFDRILNRRSPGKFSKLGVKLLNTWILPFWRLKKVDIKDKDSEI